MSQKKKKKKGSYASKHPLPGDDQLTEVRVGGKENNKKKSLQRKRQKEGRNVQKAQKSRRGAVVPAREKEKKGEGRLTLPMEDNWRGGGTNGTESVFKSIHTR